MADDDFFDQSREHSQVKARIVAKYFGVWARVMIPSAKKFSGRIAYFDIFSGPGRYEDGTLSTPLLVLQQAIADEDMRQMVVSVFNDRSADRAGKLQAAIAALPGIETLKYKPQISNKIVGDELAKEFASLKLVPTFFFIDPFGYKGLSLALIKSVVQNWGSDCIFFFNYNRVNMGLNNEKVREHMNALFGTERADKLRVAISNLTPERRERLIISTLSESLVEMGAAFVLPFAFRDKDRDRTRHYLISVTKNFKGYDIMKEIMAKESSSNVQGVPSFEFSPTKEIEQMLFEMSQPLDDLGHVLLATFAGETMTMQSVYERHTVGTNYIKRNYKKVLTTMEAEGKIAADPPAAKRKKIKGQISFADNVMVRFPKKVT